MRFYFLCCLLSIFSSITANKAIAGPPDSIILVSPDRHISFTLMLRGKKISYRVNYRKTAIIQNSSLGLVVNHRQINEGISVLGVAHYHADEKYAYRGVHNTARNKYNGEKIVLGGDPSFTLDVRVFNDGVAFRYLLSHTDTSPVITDTFLIEKDNTSFVLPEGSLIWSQPNVRNYEGKYSQRVVDTLQAGELLGPPATLVQPGLFAAITEGGLIDFAGMSLKTDGQRGLQATLGGIVKKKNSMETPWRIVEIARTLDGLVNCDIIANVSPPPDPQLFPKGYATDWVKPGRSVWSWLAQRGAVTLENMKRFSDYAAELGFEYTLVDEGWGTWRDSITHRDLWDMMKELVDYSTAKGVKIWVWKAYPNRKGIPGLIDPLQRRSFFNQCSELGIAGIKIDFFDAESQDVIDFYQSALRDAAACHLMLDFHGANKPTGESRTWPNEMTREAIRGLENRPPWAQQNTILPFTRYLAGPADYTPVNFGGRMGEVSRAHHIATMIIFTSPFLCLGADPQDLLENPCKKMIQDIPVTWDETIVLPVSKIGELAVYARRKGDDWWLAALNGTNASKTITLDLSFLKGNSIQLISVADDKDHQAGAIQSSTKLSKNKTITISLNPAGGYVARTARP